MRTKLKTKQFIYPPPKRRRGRPPGRRTTTNGRIGKLTRLSAKSVSKQRAPGYRIHMLDPDNFTVALLGEFGYYRRVIASALGLSVGQVNRRLQFAQVDPAAYRRGESVIAQMILKGVANAGVPQLRRFAEHTLRDQLQQLGWSGTGIKPTLEPAPSGPVVPAATPATVPAPSIEPAALVATQPMEQP